MNWSRPKYTRVYSGQGYILACYISALRVVQPKIGRTKAMTQSEILCWRGVCWRHDQICGLLLVKVLNFFHIASHCAFVSGLLRKLSVFVVKNCLSSFLCPLKFIGVPGNPTHDTRLDKHFSRNLFQL